MNGAAAVVLLIHAVGLFWILALALRARHYLHILQLEEYMNRRFLRWAFSERSGWLRDRRWAGVFEGALIALAAVRNLNLLIGVLALAWILSAAWITKEVWPRPAKKPIVYTARLRRLIIATGILAIAIWVAALVAANLLLRPSTAAAHYTLAIAVPITVLLLLDALVVAGGNLLAQPVEAALRRFYLRDARRRVRRLNPKIVAITGSYGKTTTKELVASILSTRFSTVKTPESWNTLMGVTRAIRERLTEQHEIFVVEMGAYHRGEIAQLCDLSGPPDIGILTGINEQHLERFGGIENTTKAKYELIQAVKPGGVGIFNVDNERVRRLADQTSHVRVLRVGLEPESAPLDYTAEDVSVSPEGTRFTCVAGGQRAQFRTRLLGEHFILNVLCAAAAAVECGMTLQQIAAAVAAMPPVPHRLQLVPSAAGITTIDDAYSANPDGARAALRVLGQMNGGRRILVTPGFVELGDREAEFNHELGTLARSACDILVLVGARHTAPIREGAVDAGMDESQIEVVGSVSAARGFLAGVARPGDTILFENDLPDNYDE
jgi:UDP-N-acetylmuramoyl-tripeptide--D-alanyl-D-alanine ligase